MSKKQKGAPESTPETKTDAKVDNYSETGKDLRKVLDYFRCRVGSSLDCAVTTKVLRNSITWYIRTLEKKNLLQPIYVKRDRTTGRMAKHYSGNPKLWVKRSIMELSLFDERDLS